MTELDEFGFIKSVLTLLVMYLCNFLLLTLLF